MAGKTSDFVYKVHIICGWHTVSITAVLMIVVTAEFYSLLSLLWSAASLAFSFSYQHLPENFQTHIHPWLPVTMLSSASWRVMSSWHCSFSSDNCHISPWFQSHQTRDHKDYSETIPPYKHTYEILVQYHCLAYNVPILNISFYLRVLFYFHQLATPCSWGWRQILCVFSSLSPILNLSIDFSRPKQEIHWPSAKNHREPSYTSWKH